MDFLEVLAAVQQWIGTEVSAAASLPGGPEFTRSTGVIGTPELLWAEDEKVGEYWIFPLQAGVGSFSLPRAAFVRAQWEIPDVRLKIELAGGELEVELA
jgi:hypothetical protein